MDTNNASSNHNKQQLNQQNIPPTALITPQITKRVLHRDDDLLPFAAHQNLATSDIYKLKSSTSSKQGITKRHLASAASTAPTSNANNYEDIVNMYASASLNKINKLDNNSTKPTAQTTDADKPARKIAVLTSSNQAISHKYSKSGPGAGGDYEEVQAFGAQSTASFSKADKEQIDRMAKKLKKIESESLGNFETVGFGQSRSGSTGGVITPGSWRIGEALVQKQLKQHLRQQQQAKQQMKLNEAEEMQQQTKKASGKKLLGDDERRSASGR
jgi:hypothetical protein